MKTTVNELREMTLALFARMEEVSDGATIEIQQDYYWAIARDHEFKVDTPPSTENLITGRISDDLFFLRRALEEDCMTSLHARKLGHLIHGAALSLDAGAW